MLEGIASLILLYYQMLCIWISFSTVALAALGYGDICNAQRYSISDASLLSAKALDLDPSLALAALKLGNIYSSQGRDHGELQPSALLLAVPREETFSINLCCVGESSLFYS